MQKVTWANYGKVQISQYVTLLVEGVGYSISMYLLPFYFQVIESRLSPNKAQVISHIGTVASHAEE